MSSMLLESKERSGFGIRIRDFHTKRGGARFGIERMQGMGDAKIIIGITGLRVNLSRDGET